MKTFLQTPAHRFVVNCWKFALKLNDVKVQRNMKNQVGLYSIMLSVMIRDEKGERLSVSMWVTLWNRYENSGMSYFNAQKTFLAHLSK